MKQRTRVNHPVGAAPAPGNRPLIEPIYQTVKYEFDTVEETQRVYRGEQPGYHYMRAGNPNARQLELTLAELQSRDDAIVSTSGVNAIGQTLLALTKQGDHVLGFLQSYGPTRQCLRRLLGRFGVTHTLLSIDDLQGLERELAARPVRCVMLESPTNPVTRIADVEGITRLARANGALTVIDNTFAGFHQHGEYDIDLYVHSLTKYGTGAGDYMGGVVIGRAELIAALRPDFNLLGAHLDPQIAFAMMQGLRTYFLRYREQCATAQRVAEFLHEHPKAAGCRYPGLASHPDAALARKQMREFGTVVTFDVAAGAEAASRCCEALQLFALTASLGSTESLCLPPQLLQPRDFTAEQLARCGIGPGTVRLSIGLEDPEDLIADLAQALERA